MMQEELTNDECEGEEGVSLLLFRVSAADRVKGRNEVRAKHGRIHSAGLSRE